MFELSHVLDHILDLYVLVLLLCFESVVSTFLSKVALEQLAPISDAVSLRGNLLRELAESFHLFELLFDQVVLLV